MTKVVKVPIAESPPKQQEILQHCPDIGQHNGQAPPRRRDNELRQGGVSDRAVQIGQLPLQEAQVDAE
jgi:hypothetical protein